MINKKILGTVILIVIIGQVMVYSASNIWAQYKFNDPYFYIKRQFIFGIIGILCMYIVSKINYKIYYKYAGKLVVLSIFLLILVLIPGIGSVRGGSRSWFNLGIVSFQPSELFKIAMIIYSAKYISNNLHALKKIKYSLPLLFVLGLGFGLIMLQPDFGSAVVMASSIVLMVIVTPFPFRYFIRLGLVALSGLIVMIISAPYRLERILAFLDPFSDPLGSGFQMIQSLYAIGPGGLMGAGFNQSMQKNFYLPEPQTDFIFAIYCEEFGFIGGVFLIVLYAYFVITTLKLAQDLHDSFGCFLLIGFISLIGVQTIINLGVVVGLFPVTGVTLPLVSYGGTSLTITLIIVGIILNISKSN